MGSSTGRGRTAATAWLAAWLAALAWTAGCSDTGKAAGLSSAGGAGTAGDAVSDSAAADGKAGASSPADLGYLQLNPALSGHWMRREIGNCIDLETWLSFLVPDGFVHTEVDRNVCSAHQVRKTAGELKLLPNQLLQYTWHAKQAALPQWQQRKVTAALVDELPGGAAVAAQPGYQPGKRGLTMLAWVRAQEDKPFVHLDSTESVTDGAKPTHTQQVASVQVVLTPSPEVAKPGDTCSMAVVISVSWEPGDSEPAAQATEQLTLPCHYAKDPTSGWLRVAADGYEQSLTDGSWNKLFESKGLWKKHKSAVAHLLFDAFRPVLHHPPTQRNVLLSLANQGWYQEFLNDPPVSVK